MYTELEDITSEVKEALLETGPRLGMLLPRTGTIRSGSWRVKPGNIKFAQAAEMHPSPTIQGSLLLWYAKLSHLDRKTSSSTLLKMVSVRDGTLLTGTTIYSCTRCLLMIPTGVAYSSFLEESRAILSPSVAYHLVTTMSSRSVRGQILGRVFPRRLGRYV